MKQRKFKEGDLVIVSNLGEAYHVRVFKQYDGIGFVTGTNTLWQSCILHPLQVEMDVLAEKYAIATKALEEIESTPPNWPAVRQLALYAIEDIEQIDEETNE